MHEAVAVKKKEIRKQEVGELIGDADHAGSCR